MIVQYEPKNLNIKLEECYDTTKADELIEKINQANITEEEKKFLTLAAYRHLMFDYRNVADYYAIASKEVQELMEDSALVLIDFEDAIQKGFAKLYTDLEEIQGDSNE